MGMDHDLLLESHPQRALEYLVPIHDCIKHMQHFQPPINTANHPAELTEWPSSLGWATCSLTFSVVFLPISCLPACTSRCCRHTAMLKRKKKESGRLGRRPLALTMDRTGLGQRDRGTDISEDNWLVNICYQHLCSPDHQTIQTARRPVQK